MWHLFRENFPEDAKRLHVIFGNTGVEYPESLKFARQLGTQWGGDHFHEVLPLKTEKEGLKYEAQLKVLQWVADIAVELSKALIKILNGILDSVLCAGSNPKWIHYYRHSKKQRTRKKYYNLMRRELWREMAGISEGTK